MTLEVVNLMALHFKGDGDMLIALPHHLNKK